MLTSPMSLDVTLSVDALNASSFPCTVQAQVVYDANITHNLGRMADEAGIYECLWRPDEIGVNTAVQLIEPLRAGLDRLKADPQRFRALNPPNGWGTYQGLVTFVERYIEACVNNPDAEVSVSR